MLLAPLCVIFDIYKIMHDYFGGPIWNKNKELFVKLLAILIPRDTR